MNITTGVAWQPHFERRSMRNLNRKTVSYLDHEIRYLGGEDGPPWGVSAPESWKPEVRSGSVEEAKEAIDKVQDLIAQIPDE